MSWISLGADFRSLRPKLIGLILKMPLIVGGNGFQKAMVRVPAIVIAGLGWVSITGAGPCVIKVTAPAGTSISEREPLLPYEASHSTAKFTGGKIMKKSRKQGKQSYGWRAGSF